jgi:protein-S-isoprenylcysteine O-methyltransferase Ste14
LLKNTPLSPFRARSAGFPTPHLEKLQPKYIQLYAGGIMNEPAPDQEKKHAGVTVPPPLIYAGVLALGLIVDYVVDGPGTGIPWTPRVVLGGALFAVGLAVPLVASAQFRVAETDVRPWKPSSTLVTTGIYRYTRNPMYVGMTLIFAALALLADSVIALVLLPPLLVLITVAVIRREEHYLEITFGEDYRRYKQSVRRWI